MISFLGFSCFLDWNCLLLHLKQILIPTESVTYLGCQFTQWKTLPAQLVLALRFTKLHIVSPREFCVHEASQTLYVNGAARNDEIYAELVFYAHMYAPLSYETSVSKYKFKDKTTKNFKTMTTEHRTKHGAHLMTGPSLCQSPSHMLIMVPAFSNGFLIFIVQKN